MKKQATKLPNTLKINGAKPKGPVQRAHRTVTPIPAGKIAISRGEIPIEGSFWIGE